MTSSSYDSPLRVDPGVCRAALPPDACPSSGSPACPVVGPGGVLCKIVWTWTKTKIQGFLAIQRFPREAQYRQQQDPVREDREHLHRPGNRITAARVGFPDSRCTPHCGAGRKEAVRQHMQPYLSVSQGMKHTQQTGSAQHVKCMRREEPWRRAL